MTFAPNWRLWMGPVRRARLRGYSSVSFLRHTAHCGFLARGAAGSGEDGADGSGSENIDVLTSGPSGSGTEDSGSGCKSTEGSGKSGSEFG